MRHVPPLNKPVGTDYVDANLDTGQIGSYVPADVFNVLLKELTHLVEYAGLTLSPEGQTEDLTQIRQAVQAVVGNTINDITQLFTGAETTHTLSENEQGIIWVNLPDGATGTYTITLPEAVARRAYTFIRSDLQAASVTVETSGDDVIDASDTNFPLIALQSRTLVAVDNQVWATQARSAPPAVGAAVLDGQTATRPVVPSTLTALWERGVDISIDTNGLINPGLGGFFHLISGEAPLSGFDPAVLSRPGRTVMIRCVSAIDLVESTGLVTGEGDLSLPENTVVTFTSIAPGIWMLTGLRYPGLFAGRVEVGDVKWRVSSIADPGWMLMDGRALDRTQYADLFTTIGANFGDGNGTTTFNIPDWRGRAVFGMDDMGTAAGAAGRLTSAGGLDPSAIGNVGGTETVTQTLAQLATHGHPVAYSREALGGKDAEGHIPVDLSPPLEIHEANSGAPEFVTDDLSTNAVGGAGASEPMPNMPPAALGYPFIYTGVLTP